MTELTDTTQQVIDNYPELEEVSEEALLALGQAMGLEVLKKHQQSINQDVESVEKTLEKLLGEKQ